MAWSPQRIVVPFDFSEESKDALNVAIEIASQGGGQVNVIHVLPDLSVTDPGVVWESVTDESRIETTLKAVRKLLADLDYKDLSTDVAIGDAGHEIADFAAEKNADLIVLSSHGRRGLQRVLIGSVAERVLRLARCQVLVLRK